MPEHSRSKTLTLEVFRSRWCEDDLARLAKTIRQHTGECRITIVTGDGEDTLSGDDPDFFRSSDMPSSVRSVEIAAHKIVECETKLAIPAWGFLSGDGATIKVSGGNSAAVSALYRDLEREFKSRALFGDRAIRFLHGPGGWLSALILTSAVLFSVSFFFLQVLGGTVGSLARSVWGGTALILGAGIVLVFGVALTGRIMRVLWRAFPPVEFCGKLAASNSFHRVALVWVLLFVLLPLLINLLAGLILLRV